MKNSKFPVVLVVVLLIMAMSSVAVGQDKHQAILNHVAFDGTRLIAVGGGDSGGAIVFWDATAMSAPFVAKPKGHLQAFAVNRTGTRLYAAGHGGFQVWQLRSL